MASWIMGGQELFLPSACTWVLGHVPIHSNPATLGDSYQKFHGVFLTGPTTKRGGGSILPTINQAGIHDWRLQIWLQKYYTLVPENKHNSTRT